MAQRGNRGGRSNTRKPVTIDLEATPDPAQTPDDVQPAAEQTSVTEPDTSGVESGDAPRPAEPVAMDEASVTAASDDTSMAEPDTKPEAEPEDVPAEDPSPETKPETVAGPTTIVQKRGVSAIGGGIVGGLLTLLGAAGLQSAGMLPNLGGADAAVTQTAPAVDLSPLEAQIAALQAELDTVRAGADGSAAAALPADVQAQLDAVTSAATDANARAETAQTELAAMAEQFAALQQAVSSGDAGEGAGLQAIAGRIDALEAQTNALANAEPTPSEAPAPFDPAVAIAALQPSLDGVNEQVTALSADFGAVSQTLEGVTGEIATLQQSVASLTDNQAATTEQLAALSGQVTANSERLEQSGAGNTVAKAIAASGLKSAADRGLPFMAELETFASAGGDAEALATLRDFAAAGVPTRAQLVEQFGPVANAIVASNQNLGEDASIADRLMNSARSLVQVRDLDEVEGESVSAITNRIDAALKADDLDNALAQWETLPDTAKQVSADFADQLRARQNVDGLLNTVLTQAMAATAPSADQ